MRIIRNIREMQREVRQCAEASISDCEWRERPTAMRTVADRAPGMGSEAKKSLRFGEDVRIENRFPARLSR